MTSQISFALALRRVFDLTPPEGPVSFWADGRRLCPLRKPGGVYVFLEGAGKKTVESAGYLPAENEAQAGGMAFCVLFPQPGYSAPPGWRVTSGCAPPGLLCWADPRYTLRPAEWDEARGVARIRSRPNLMRGMLLLQKGAQAQLAPILEKEPPDRFFLGRLPWDPRESEIQKVWAARADARGRAAVVTPEGVLPGEPVWMEGGGGQWVSEP